MLLAGNDAVRAISERSGQSVACERATAGNGEIPVRQRQQPRDQISHAQGGSSGSFSIVLISGVAIGSVTSGVRPPVHRDEQVNRQVDALGSRTSSYF